MKKYLIRFADSFLSNNVDTGYNIRTGNPARVDVLPPAHRHNVSDFGWECSPYTSRFTYRQVTQMLELDVASYRGVDSTQWMSAWEKNQRCSDAHQRTRPFQAQCVPGLEDGNTCERGLEMKQIWEFGWLFSPIARWSAIRQIPN